jgi:adenine-specific DNA-methyltransferase
LTHSAPSLHPTHGNLRLGFVYERIPHITLKSIANNAEIDIIWEKWQASLEPLRDTLNIALDKQWQEWEIPREVEPTWPEVARQAHPEWWAARIARQTEIDASTAAKTEFEYLYDNPCEDRRKVRVAGPFTVESLSPHRVLMVNEHGEFVDGLAQAAPESAEKQSFPADDPGELAHLGCAAGAQGRSDHFQIPDTLARRSHLRRGPLRRG